MNTDEMEWPENPKAEFYGDPCDADVYEGPAEWGAEDDMGIKGGCGHTSKDVETAATILGYLIGAVIVVVIIVGLAKVMS